MSVFLVSVHHGDRSDPERLVFGRSQRRDALFAQNGSKTVDESVHDLLMITAMWYPPFTMMVKRYCGKQTRDELEKGGRPLPFPGKEFHVWDVSLNNFAHVAAYLASRSSE